MKKRMFVIVGLALGLAAASFFIPLSDGNFWWSAWSEPVVVAFESPDRIPAGNPTTGTPVDTTGYDPTIPDEPVAEAEPEYPSNGKDQPAPEPVYPDPAPAPEPAPAPVGNCIDRAFSGERNKRDYIDNVRFSNAYTNSYMRAAMSKPYNLGDRKKGCGARCKRLAIMGIVTAGYCKFTSKYQNSFRNSSVLPNMNGRWDEHSLTDRVNHWGRTQDRNPLYCGDRDAFRNQRKTICSIAYKFCGLDAYVKEDCYAKPDKSGGGKDHGGGSNSGGTTGESGREVEPGITNDDAGHKADPGGAMGPGPGNSTTAQ